MKIFYTLGGSYLIHNKQFPIGTVILQLENKVEIACSNFNIPKEQDLLVFLYNPSIKTWEKYLMKNKYTQIMWRFYRKNRNKINPPHRPHYSHKSYKDKFGPCSRSSHVPSAVRWAAANPFYGGRMS